MEEIILYRESLEKTKEALKNNKLVIGFVGGSITAGDENTGGLNSNWPEFIRSYFLLNYPDVRLTLINTAIGGNGTLSGITRAKKELIENKCDLVFIDCVVNDGLEDIYKKSEEGLVRLLLKAGIDLAFVYLFARPQYNYISSGKNYPKVEYMEILANHYNISSIYSGLYAYKAVERGEISFETWLPKSGGYIHPDFAGSFYYSKPVCEYLNKELGESNHNLPSREKLPEPILKDNFENIYEIPADTIAFDSTFVKIREMRSTWYKWQYYSPANGSKLSFKFKGTTLICSLNFGKRTPLFLCRIDNGEWKEYKGQRDWWVPDVNWITVIPFAENLENKEHFFELKTLYRNEESFTGTEFKLYGFSGVV